MASSSGKPSDSQEKCEKKTTAQPVRILRAHGAPVGLSTHIGPCKRHNGVTMAKKQKSQESRDEARRAAAGVDASGDVDAQVCTGEAAVFKVVQQRCRGHHKNDQNAAGAGDSRTGKAISGG